MGFSPMKMESLRTDKKTKFGIFSSQGGVVSYLILQFRPLSYLKIIKIQTFCKDMVAFLSTNLDQRRRTFRDDQGFIWVWSDQFIVEKVTYYKDRIQLPW